MQWQLRHLLNFSTLSLLGEKTAAPRESSRESGILMGERLEQGGERNVQGENTSDYGC